MKVLLEYDPISGTVNDSLGVFIGVLLGLPPYEETSQSTSIDDMIKLKNSGFTAEEVIAIKKANL